MTSEPLEGARMRRTKAQLPTAGVRDGAQAWATDGRKTGESAAAGTGCPVYFTESDRTWRRFYDDTEVTV